MNNLKLILLGIQFSRKLKNLGSFLCVCCSMMPREMLLNSDIKRIIGIGSALTRNKVLQREVEQQYLLPVSIALGHDAALGAALVGIPKVFIIYLFHFALLQYFSFLHSSFAEWMRVKLLLLCSLEPRSRNYVTKFRVSFTTINTWNIETSCVNLRTVLFCRHHC